MNIYDDYKDTVSHLKKGYYQVLPKSDLQGLVIALLVVKKYQNAIFFDDLNDPENYAVLMLK